MSSEITPRFPALLCTAKPPSFTQGNRRLELAHVRFRAVEKPVHVHDLHTMILHLLGIDHTKRTYRYLGRDFGLTDVSGVVQHV
ncbi:MAG: DUF1501 domain-containing protein [Pedosphaera sp.]|nr:DUF1501 domain-containing protein [Pedosphaera sp.]